MSLSKIALAVVDFRIVSPLLKFMPFVVRLLALCVPLEK